MGDSDNTLQTIGAIAVSLVISSIVIFVIVKIIKYAWTGTW